MRRTRVSVDAYLANIRQKFKSVPKDHELYKMDKDEELDAELREGYALLVNAFGWNSGQTSRFAQRLKASTASAVLVQESQDIEDSADSDGSDARVAAEDRNEPEVVENADDETAASPAARLRHARARRKLLAEIQRGLAVFPHPQSQLRVCARRKARGGLTSAFETPGMLYAHVADVYGALWQNRLVLRKRASSCV